MSQKGKTNKVVDTGAGIENVSSQKQESRCESTWGEGLKGNGLVDEIMEELENENIAKTEVWQLLRDMEMVDETGKSGWGDEEMNGDQGSKMVMEDILDVFPVNILPTKQEVVPEGQVGHKPGYSIRGGMSDNQENGEIRKNQLRRKLSGVQLRQRGVLEFPRMEGHRWKRLRKIRRRWI
jgi:hypothetical protein